MAAAPNPKGTMSLYKLFNDCAIWNSALWVSTMRICTYTFSKAGYLEAQCGVEVRSLTFLEEFRASIDMTGMSDELLGKL